MARSVFTAKGLPLGKNNVNMTYLYGLADFFAVMFQDTGKQNLFLEGGAQVAAETYSKFLQLTSTVSLENIQNTLSQSMEMIILKSTDYVSDEVNVYNLPETVISTRYIANRPLLPTSLLEQGVDYRIELVDGQHRIRFARPISTAGFSTRPTTDALGNTVEEYALWFVDSEIDEQWMSTYFADLIGVNPQDSSDAYKNFVYGLYYIYINGPTLDLLRKGLNLCLGVPLARETETVIEIRKYPETDQYIVVTDMNQYLIPYGLTPNVVEGQTMNVGDELAQWVEVKDYIHDGDWWINLMIPASIIPSTPEGQINRYATEGSHFDFLMRRYLKKHTFLVNVKVKDFKNNQVFQQLSDIINRAKPVYTQAIYIWTVPQLEETLTLEEEILIQRRDQSRCENLTLPIEQFYRGNATTPIKRGCPMFTRFNVPYFVTKLCGTNTYTNGNPFTYGGSTVQGFINPMEQYRPATDTETAWMRTLLDRDSETIQGTRGKLGFTRGIHYRSDAAINYAGIPVHTTAKMANVPAGRRIIPLYVTTQTDLKKKCDIAGIRTPDLVEWTFDLLNPLTVSEEINALAINEGTMDTSTSLLAANYNTMMFRGSDVNYLSNIMPELSWRTWAPTGPADLNVDDYLIGIRIFDQVLGIYLVTSNTNMATRFYEPVEDNDNLTLTMTKGISRGMGPTSSPYYVVRGRGYLDYNNVLSEINADAINEGGPLNTSVLDNSYTDSINTVPMVMDRSGKVLVHKTELK